MKILRLQKVTDLVGLKRSSIYNLMAEGRFPKPITLGGKRAVGWIDQEVNDWLEQQIEASRKDTQ
ncbi:AlpA family transcriptional regulator [bacterium endosymbiont of Escarpia laminata]|nr:MAG: AlpA family transcriptional regulator [bacterium endosymbiont of Escarpia laminata]